MRGLTWATMWASVRLDLGNKEPTFGQVRDWWNLSNAQAYRYQQSYRRCWPPHARSPWILTQCAIDQGLTSERKLRVALKFTKAFKGVGANEPQREVMVTAFTNLVGAAAAA